MVSPPPTNEDFYAKAMASLNQQMALANGAAAVEIESYAKSLVEDDLPKIDAAVKSYLSLVAARSAVASDVDVVSASASSILLGAAAQCTFAASGKSPVDVNRCALTCARTLLSAINSTMIPPPESLAPPADNREEKNEEGGNDGKAKLQENATRILWNRLVQQCSGGAGDKAKRSKPSRLLGRESLLVAYPYVQERIRRGVRTDNQCTHGATEPASRDDNPLGSFSDEALPPVSPPKGVDPDQWEAFHAEFGRLLDRACTQSSTAASEAEDDSALLWSGDGGSSELRRRREARARRATEATALANGDGAAATKAVLDTVPENSPGR